MSKLINRVKGVRAPNTLNANQIMSRDSQMNNSTHGNSLKFNKIKSTKAYKLFSKEQKAIAYLLTHKNADRWVLGHIADDDGYCPNVVSNLRHKKGFKLITDRFDYIGKNGKPTWKGLYSIATEHLDKAREFIGNIA